MVFPQLQDYCNSVNPFWMKMNKRSGDIQSNWLSGAVSMEPEGGQGLTRNFSFESEEG